MAVNVLTESHPHTGGTVTGSMSRRSVFRRPRAALRTALLGALTLCLAVAAAGAGGATASAVDT
ncbi:MAG: hypothetical protein QOF98_1398, partial [Streptomyces sp.]|nr:hypothetical protein [Streptomyces sp.]